MKASKSLIKFYKGIVCARIANRLNEQNDFELEWGLTDEQKDWTIDEVDHFIRLKSEIETDISTTKLSTIEVDALCRQGFDIGDKLGIRIDFPSERNEFKQFE